MYTCLGMWKHHVNVLLHKPEQVYAFVFTMQTFGELITRYVFEMARHLEIHNVHIMGDYPCTVQ